MSDIEEFEFVEPPEKPSAALHAIASAREKLTRFLPRAVEIITELAETSENDRVRLAAAESIADRAGLGKSSTQQVQVSQAEHEIANTEAADLLKRIEDNQSVILAPKHEIPLEVLIVHESEGDDVPVEGHV